MTVQQLISVLETIRLDHLLAVHGLARFPEYLGGSVQSAQLAGRGRIVLGLGRFLGCLLGRTPPSRRFGDGEQGPPSRG